MWTRIRLKNPKSWVGAFCLVALAANGQTTGFIANEGQWALPCDFKLELKPGNMYIEPTRILFDLREFSQHHLPKGEDHDHPHGGFPKAVRGHTYTIDILGAQRQIPTAGQPLSQYYNYFYGQDPKRWKGGVGLYRDLHYAEVYPGVDLDYHFDGQLKYEFTVAPGASADLIKLVFSGQDSLYLADGELVIETALGKVKELKPFSYQLIDGEKVEVAVDYLLRGDTVQFAIRNGYRREYPLVIDPELVFSTYISSPQSNFGFTATFSADNGGYLGSIVFNDGNGRYPTTVGAYQDTFTGGNVDIGLSRFSNDGSQLIYSTYFGGRGNEVPISLFEAANGDLLVMGNTGSRNFPVTAGAFDTSYAVGPSFNHPVVFDNNSEGADIFVTRFSNDGRQLKASTFMGDTLSDGVNRLLGDARPDVARGEIIADSNTGNIYVVTSANSHRFPSSGQRFDTLQGAQDGAIFCMDSSLSTLRWGRLIGGSGNEALFSVKLSPTGRLYAAGATSAGLNMGIKGGWQDSAQGKLDGFIAELNPTDGKVLHLTYTGTAEDDITYLIDINGQGQVYATGTTRGAYPQIDSNLYSVQGSAHFIQEFSPDLSLSPRSMLFGDGDNSRDNLSVTAFMVDFCGNVYLAGWGGFILPGSIGAIDSLPVTLNALQSSTDRRDFYFLIVDASWQRLNFASYFGENGGRGDHVDGGTSRFRKDGTIYEAVCASCGSTNGFPTTQNAWGDSNLSNNCNAALVRLKLEADSVIASVEATVEAGRDSLCIPYRVELTDRSFNNDLLIAIAPDGSRDTLSQDTIVINQLGRQRYRFIAIDTTCNLRDTTSLTFYGIAPPSLNVSAQAAIDSCAEEPVADFTINSNLNPAFRYRWLFGDSSSSAQVPQERHQYPDTGFYQAALVVTDTFCGLSDTLSFPLNFEDAPEPTFSLDNDPCLNFQEVILQSDPIPGNDYIWRLNDVVVGSGDSLALQVTEPGLYQIGLELYHRRCDTSLFLSSTFEINNPREPVTMPNIFTPNGDGINDVFGPVGGTLNDYFTRYSLQIFNRWGQLLFESAKPTNRWDGRVRNGPAPTGVYYYLLGYTNACGQAFELRGFTHLER